MNPKWNHDNIPDDQTGFMRAFCFGSIRNGHWGRAFWCPVCQSLLVELVKSAEGALGLDCAVCHKTYWNNK